MYFKRPELAGSPSAYIHNQMRKYCNDELIVCLPKKSYSPWNESFDVQWKAKRNKREVKVADKKQLCVHLFSFQILENGVEKKFVNG